MDSLPLSVSSSDFIDLLQGNEIRIEDMPFSFLNTESQFPFVMISDIIVEDNIEIDYNINFKYPIVLENCMIEKLKISHCSFSKLHFKSGVYGDIFIINSNFNELNFSGGTYNNWFISGDFKRIRISNCILNSIFSLSESIIHTEFKITSGIFSNVYFRKNDFKKNFWIAGGEFKSKIKIGACTAEYFEISEGTFEEEIGFYKLNNIQDLWISGGTFRSFIKLIDGNYGHLSILNGNIQSFNITGGEFSKDVNILGGTFNFIKVTNGSFKSIIIKSDSPYCDKTLINTLHIKTNNTLSLTIDSIVLNRFRLHYILRRESTILFQNTNPRKIVFKNFTNNGKIIFNHVTPKNEFLLKTLNREIKSTIDNSPIFQLWKEQNTISEIIQDLNSIISKENILGSELLQSLKNLLASAKRVDTVKNELVIMNSVLGDTEFRDVNFRKLGKIYCLNSNISTIKQHGEFLPSLKRIKYYFDNNPEFLLDRNRPSYKWTMRKDFYRDLTTAATNQKDILKRIDYFASYQNSILHTSENDYSVKFSIWFNKYTNDYGRSWILGIIITIFIFGLIPFIFYMHSLGFSLSRRPKDMIATFGYFSEFILPIHKIDFMNSIAEMTGWSKFFDLLGRILVSLGIYQTIQAFRKIGKSGE
jgi:hypothetical protein